VLPEIQEATPAPQVASPLPAQDPNLDFGNGLTATAYETEINETEALLEKYNEKLAEIDGIRNEFLLKERKLSETTKRVLSGAATMFGEDSFEYEKVGGVRTSQIKHHKKAKVA
jgi:hypothetical protein